MTLPQSSYGPEVPVVSLNKTALAGNIAWADTDVTIPHTVKFQWLEQFWTMNIYARNVLLEPLRVKIAPG